MFDERLRLRVCVDDCDETTGIWWHWVLVYSVCPSNSPVAASQQVEDNDCNQVLPVVVAIAMYSSQSTARCHSYRQLQYPGQQKDYTCDHCQADIFGAREINVGYTVRSLLLTYTSCLEIAAHHKVMAMCSSDSTQQLHCATCHLSHFPGTDNATPPNGRVFYTSYYKLGHAWIIISVVAVM